MKIVPFFAVWVVIVAGIIASALMVFSPDSTSEYLCRGEFFTLNVILTVLFVSCMWWGGGVAFKKLIKVSEEDKAGGHIPAIAAAIFNTSAISLILLAVFAFALKDKYHAIFGGIEILLWVLCVVRVFMMSSTVKFQSVGMEELAEAIKKPDQLAAYLSICERQKGLSATTLANIAKCKNTISFSIPKVGNIAKSDMYKDIAKRIEDLYNNMQNENIENCDTTTEELCRDAQLLAQSLKR